MELEGGESLFSFFIWGVYIDIKKFKIFVWKINKNMGFNKLKVIIGKYK